MSFIITIHTYEGVVMAADSRLTLNTKVPVAGGTRDLSIQFSNATRKLFSTRRGVGISTCGDAGIKGNPIAGYLMQFALEHPTDEPEQLARKLTPFLKVLNPSLDATFHVSGYDNAGVQYVARVFTFDGSVRPIDTSIQGVIWNGELDVMQRLLNEVWEADASGMPAGKLPRYTIPWNYFSLQDAVDFAKFAMETTIGAIRFQDRPKTVGGPVDVLVLKRNGGEWIQRKSLGYRSGRTTSAMVDGEGSVAEVTAGDT